MALVELKNGIVRYTSADFEEATRIRTDTGQRIYAYFEAAIDERERKRGDDLLSYLLDAEAGGERLTRNDVLDICFLFLLGGLYFVDSCIYDLERENVHLHIDLRRVQRPPILTHSGFQVEYRRA